MSDPKPAKKPKPWWLGAIFVAIGVAILLTLGTWQVQRLKWKEGLLAHIAELQGAPAVPLSSVIAKPAQDLDFVRVAVSCPGINDGPPPLYLYSILDGEPGARLIQACRVGDKVLLVDTGFTRTELVLSVDGEPLEQVHKAAKQAAERWRTSTPKEPLVGVLRIPSKRNGFTPGNDAASGVWYSMDIPAMSGALSPAEGGRPIEGQALPVVLMLERPQVSVAKPAPLPKEISNNHLDYALTWYGLAAALVGVYIAMLLRRRTAR